MEVLQSAGQPVRFVGISNKILRAMTDEQLVLERGRVQNDLTHWRNMVNTMPKYCRREPIVVREGRVLKSEQKRIETEITHRDFMAALEFGRAQRTRALEQVTAEVRDAVD